MSSVDTARTAIAKRAKVCKTKSAIDFPPNSIIDLRDVVTPRPAIANTKHHCETPEKNSDRIEGIKPLLLITKHIANASANQGKALGLILLVASPLFNIMAIIITMIGSIEIRSNLINVAISPVSLDTAYPAPTT